jgi:hypothetical protein
VSEIGTLFVIVTGAPNSGLFIYNGTPGSGNLIGSWTGSPGTDPYGNTYPAGINVFQGQLTGVTINTSTIIDALIQGGIIGPDLNGPVQIQQPQISGGTITETQIVFDTTSGSLVAYATTTTTTTQTVSGTYNFSVPAGVTQARVQCWGAGAGGGGGGSTEGGEGGGGGEYAEEPSYPLTPLGTVGYAVGNGGSGGITGQTGTDGTDTSFDTVNSGVVANGGDAGSGFVHGKGGTGSTNTIHHNGGNGGDGTGGDTGGAGGGGSAGATGAGGTGTTSTGSTGQAGGAAGTGGGAAGGAGGNNAANGSSGASPGGAGGGAGAGSSTNTFDKTYTATGTHSYAGSDGTDSNVLIDNNGRCYQGGDDANTFNGKSKSWLVFNSGQIQSDLAGVTLTQVKLRLNCSHTWFNSGMTVCVGSGQKTSFGSTASDPSSNIDQIEYSQTVQVKTKDIGSTNIGGRFKNGTDNCIVLFKNSNNLQYYGYFAGSSQSSPPTLEFIGTTGTGSTQAGAGQDGKVVITYTSGTSVLFSMCSTAFTDQFGNSIPQGNYFWNSGAPVATAGAVGVYATNGQLAMINPAGLATNVSGAQLGTFPNVTVSGVGPTTVISATIPASDAEIGAVYELYVAGNGTQGSTAQGVQGTIKLGATVIGNQPTSGTGFAAVGTIFRWEMTGRLVCITTGSGGTWFASFSLTLTQNTASNNAQTICASNSVATAISTVVSNVLALQLGWGSTTGGPTLGSNFGYFKRVA